MSNHEHLIQAYDEGVRYDDRDLQEFRDISIEKGVISTAEGSAKITCGETEILAGVKLEMGSPYPDKPNQGTLRVNAEHLAMSNPEFETGRPGINSVEVSRVIDRGLRECGIIDTEALCVTPGEKVWTVSVDIIPLNYDGNFMDLGGIAALIALHDAKMPGYSDEEGVDYENLTDDDLPLTDEMPVPVTLCKIGDHVILDPTDMEEREIDARLTVTTLDTNTVCSLQKGGDDALTFDEINDMIDVALTKADELRSHI
jgi:exosome complex component RRP42